MEVTFFKRGLCILFCLSACVSQTPQAPSEVLEPVKEEVPSEAPESSAPSKSLQQLQERLSALGYEGVGLELESETVLQTLLAVFSDPQTADRQIARVYTGIQNAYDVAQQSLTLGGTQNPKAMIAFIKQKVPLRKKP